MAVTARYTTPLQVPVRPDVRTEVERIAEENHVSQAEVVRRCIARSLGDVEAQLIAESRA